MVCWACDDHDDHKTATSCVAAAAFQQQYLQENFFTVAKIKKKKNFNTFYVCFSILLLFSATTCDQWSRHNSV